MSPQDRARAAHAAAEASPDPRDRAAFKAAARLWERVSGPGEPLSWEPVTRDLLALKRAVAAAAGPFQPPPPAPPAQYAALVRELRANGGPAARELANRLEVPVIEF